MTSAAARSKEIVLLMLSRSLFGFCVWSLDCNVTLNASSSFAIISMRKRELVALSCYHVVVIFLFLFLVVPWWVGLQSVIVVFSGHTHIFFIDTRITFYSRNKPLLPP